MQRNSAGFTLVEVLVATAILVTVAAGTAQLFGVALRHDLESRRQLAMAAAAAAKMDELAGVVALAAAPVSAAGALDRAARGYSDSITVSGFALQRRWTVSPIAEVPTAVALVVRVVSAPGAAADYEVASVAEAGTP